MSIEAMETSTNRLYHCRLTMEPFAEKPTDNLLGLYFILYQVRGEQSCVWGCLTQFNVQFFIAEKLQK